MSYHTYTTEALVCGSYDRLTADRTYLLFTESAGMVFATARSAREERSKQRYALQDFAHVRVSLIKGKSGWRVGSVEPIQNFYLHAPTRAVRGTVVAVTQHLRRLLTGEEANPTVFADTMLFLRDLHQCDAEHAGVLLETYRLRTLAHLGYVGFDTTLAELLAPGSQWLQARSTLPPQAAKAIEHGLAASQL